MIPSNIWSVNQAKYRESRKGYSETEKNRLLKGALYEKLKEMNFEKRSSHTKLKFQLTFAIDEEENTHIVTLCETCFITFNEHKCKFYLRESN